MKTTSERAVEATSLSVAINFDQRATRLLQFGAHLSSLLNLDLQLVHLVEPVEQYGSMIHSPGWEKIQQGLSTLQGGKGAAARQQLATLASQLSPSVPVTTRIEEGVGVEGLIEGADSPPSYMMLCGAGQEGRFFPRGFSTPLALAAQAPWPVMILNDDCLVDLNKAPMKLLLCDDLTPQSQPVVDFAFDFASRLPSSKLYHVHIQTITTSGLQTAISAILPLLKEPRHPSLAYAEMMHDLRERLEGAMQSRRGSGQALLEASGGRYHSEIIPGFIHESIDAYITQHDIDVVIFGKHVGFHRKPFYLGQIPISMMVSLKRPIIIAPIDAS